MAVSVFSASLHDVAVRNGPAEVSRARHASRDSSAHIEPERGAMLSRVPDQLRGALRRATGIAVGKDNDTPPLLSIAGFMSLTGTGVASMAGSVGARRTSVCQTVSPCVPAQRLA